MCGRYTLTFTIEEIRKAYNAINKIDFIANYNVAPSQQMPIIIREDNINKILSSKWGFVSKINEKYKSINVRSETIQNKFFFKKAFNNSRCLIPANGFYEWKRIGSKKVPYYITLKERDLFSFAGIYENGTYGIITASSSVEMAKIHDRMPLILPKKLESDWISSSFNNSTELNEMLISINEKFNFQKVSNYVNSVKNNDIKCIQGFYTT